MHLVDDDVVARQVERGRAELVVRPVAVEVVRPAPVGPGRERCDVLHVAVSLGGVVCRQVVEVVPAVPDPDRGAGVVVDDAGRVHG